MKNYLLSFLFLVGCSVCGNGRVDSFDGETCDDGNAAASDGCSAGCQIEFCGDGDVNNLGTEQCDDNNLISGDGCSSVCLVEFCGDGDVNNLGTEQCDDGNLNEGDGCTAQCQLKPCGDGVLDPSSGEECDDGLSNSDDTPNACRENCTLPFCGDGVIDLGEDCDQLDDDEGNGCDTNCRSGCGSGIINPISNPGPGEDPPEQCDDGNLVDNDFCSSVCLLRSCFGEVQTINTAPLGGSPKLAAGNTIVPSNALDLAVLFNSNQVSFFHNTNGLGSFSTAPFASSSLSGETILSFTIQELDVATSNDDLLLVSSNSTNISIFGNVSNVDPSANTPTQAAFGGVPYFVTGGNLDGDSLDDVVFLSSSATESAIVFLFDLGANVSGSQHSKLLSTDGDFTRPTFVTIGSLIGGAATNDVLLLGGNGGPNDFVILYDVDQVSPFSFDGASVGDSSTAEFVEAVIGSFAPNNTINSKGAIIFREDGDLFLLQQVGELPSGEPDFEATFIRNLSPAPESIASGDFSGDGLDDFAIADGSTTLTLFINNPVGGGFSEFFLTSSQQIHSVIAADFNSDGRLDIATAQETSVTVFLRNANCN